MNFNLKEFLKGIKIILTTDPIKVLKLWAVGDSEEAKVIRYSIYMFNFMLVNLGIIIALLSVYMWVIVTSPDSITFGDNLGHRFNIKDISNMNPSCLLMCNNSMVIDDQTKRIQ